MKDIVCNVCGGRFKRRRLGRSLEYCGKCKEIVCTAHITEVKYRTVKRRPFGIPDEAKIRMCKLCLAENALTMDTKPVEVTR